TMGDWLSKPHASGGLALGTYGTSAALLAILIIGITYTYRKTQRTAAPGTTTVGLALNDDADTAPDALGTR
ncbi:hypothetical protein ABZW16_43185, partial [Nocardia sp. NPDC004604]